MSVPSAVAPPHFALRMGLFFAGYFFVNGIAMPFFPVWLQARGFADAEIASIIAIPMAFRVAVSPLGGIIADLTPTRRFAIRLFVLPAAPIFAIAWWVDGFWPILLLTGGAFTIWQLAMPGAEALALTGSRHFGADYGRMRLGASAGFITANLGSGALLGLLPVDAIFWFMFGGLVVAVAVSFILPRTPARVRALDDATRPAGKTEWRVLARPAILALIIVGGLIQASHAVFYGFSSLYWHSLGFSSFQIGLFWSAAIVCEIAFFVWSGGIVRRIGPFAMLVIGALAAIARWALMAVDLGGIGFFLLQGLHGLTYASVFLGNQFALSRTVPEDLTGSAQGLFVLISGLLMAATMAAAGPLYAWLNAGAFLAMTAMPVAALVILAVYRSVVRDG